MAYISACFGQLWVKFKTIYYIEDNYTYNYQSTAKYNNILLIPDYFYLFVFIMDYYKNPDCKNSYIFVNYYSHWYIMFFIIYFILCVCECMYECADTICRRRL